MAEYPCAIVSDIHANLEALQMVLQDITQRGIKDILCLGDVIGYGPNPREALFIAMERFEFTLMGNHEEAVLFNPVGFNWKAEASASWTREQLNLRDRPKEENHKLWDFVGGLKPSRLEEERKILFVHASPSEPLKEYILPADAGSPDVMERIFSKLSWVGFGGHTHHPGIFTEDGRFIRQSSLNGPFDLEGGRYFVNVGSVGQPRDGDPRACYAIFDGKTIEYRRIAYDFQATAQKILQTRKLPKELGQRLAVGL
jgi:diadenosine tetraphosphatase ApaH/serine/threonine PP2A family protein phosphatase